LKLKFLKRKSGESGESGETEEEPQEHKKKGALRENLEAVVIAVILALFIRAFVVQAFKIPSGSMKETLKIGDHILVNKFLYGVRLPFTDITLIPGKKPQREDIIVFKYPEDPSKDFIKRVIGLPGDVIQIRDKQLYINHKLFRRDYAIHTDNRLNPGYMGPRDNFGPVTVPEGKLFVMGDNRDYSADSRFWGFVDMDSIKGKAFIIYWSWNKNNEDSILDYVRWHRIGKLIH
jgi:signal peptidase I